MSYRSFFCLQTERGFMTDIQKRFNDNSMFLSEPALVLLGKKAGNPAEQDVPVFANVSKVQITLLFFQRSAHNIEVNLVNFSHDPKKNISSSRFDYRRNCIHHWTWTGNIPEGIRNYSMAGSNYFPDQRLPGGPAKYSDR